MQITALYAGLLGLILVYLSYGVVVHRKKHQVGIGDGDNKELSLAIRVHANFTEYVPIALILLAILESFHGNPLFVHLGGILLVVARVLHAYGLGKSVGASFGRVLGTSVSWLVILGLSGFNIYYSLVTPVIV